MADWEAFNDWEEDDRRGVLPLLTVKESFHQFCDL